MPYQHVYCRSWKPERFSVGEIRESEGVLKLRITKCNDPLMWYAEMVGQTVPLLRTIEKEGCYISVEPAGFSNIVKFGDAEVVNAMQ